MVVLDTMRPGSEPRRKKRVDDGEQKNARRDRIERIRGDAIGECGKDTVLRRWILRQRRRENCFCVFDDVVLTGQHNLKL